jgi:hypothetical protein
MSLPQKSARPSGPRRSHAARRHGSAASPTQAPRIPLALQGAGWHVTELRPSGTDEPILWRVTIERHAPRGPVPISAQPLMPRPITSA